MLVILIGVIYFIFGMMMFNLLKEDVTRVRSATELNCTGQPDTSGDMVTCLVVDGVIPLIILGVVSMTGGYITERVLR